MSGRQQPGSACEECRKRKLRCDRKRPQCGTCADTGTLCQINDRRQRRGPRKGSINALRRRIVVSEQPSDLEDLMSINGPDVDMNETRGLGESTTTDEDTVVGQPRDDCMQDTAGTQNELSHTHIPPDFSSIHHLPYPSSGASMLTDLMKWDLVQLYFDRVHPVVPILSQSRTYGWSQDPNTMNQYQRCLQYAMWTLAMARSTQFDQMGDILYAETRAMLDALDLADSDMGAGHVEQAQAWILLTLYEFSRTNYRRGWVSAGRVFRHVQLLQLYDLDSLEAPGAEEDTIDMEEKRRTFWVAYCLDRFVSISNGSPLTLNEEVICTRLPCSEAEFQNGTPRPECFLSQAMASSDPHSLSPLAECTVLVTICGRAMAHHRVSTVERVYSNMPLDFWACHEWLHSMLVKRIKNLTAMYPSFAVVVDPMAIFACMVAQAAIIYLCTIIEALTEDEDEAWAESTPVTVSVPVSTYQERGLQAAREIVRLAREHERLGYFKAHFFLPLTLFLSAKWLATHSDRRKVERSSSETDTEALQALLNILRKMEGMNNLAAHHLSILQGFRSR
ncbi:Zn(II)2Cys6 transcription factor [Aspergillus clavatus NRRL 1]|uniref:Fungal specific transcription factor domain protein n=1 Tax=Aspergillus clavatus (strain ATCC 1007 / CBS 513.65 / DSM 816 / NCTC 3887 / NRRL 1 / QM 1276 / 107) TaxID=344612 RepID=A1C5P4_ASPCL|nr:fungal specific transcription factor domain protein [Aspergillus clavatus NRRL 1]EAW15012.1 fungal specific transcription factor domain protein [Aspergillus clavatus NRRL 1]